MQARGYIVRHCPVGTDLVDWMSSTLSDDVAAIYVNTPHNPTGSVLPAASLALIDRAGMHGARVIVDAVYEISSLTASAATCRASPTASMSPFSIRSARISAPPACGSAGSSRPPRTSPS